MAGEHQDSPYLTKLTAEAISQYRLIRLNGSGAWVYCDAGEIPLAVSDTAEASGDALSGVLLNKPGTHEIEAAGAITTEADIFAAADGKVAATGVVKVGKALEAASGSGSIIQVIIDVDAALTTPIITTAINDANGNESIRITATASAVNEVTVTNSVTGAAPTIVASGDDTNVGLTLKGKGSGIITLQDGGGLELLKTARVASAVNELTVSNAATGNKPIIAATGEADNGIEFHNDQAEQLLILACTPTAVNEVTITNAATGNGPSVAATGETNVPITLAGKGTGQVLLGQATSGGVKLVATQPLLDQNANELVKFTATGSAVNEITVANAATGNKPVISVTGEADNGIEFHNDQAEQLLILASVASAVNEITITNAATGANPTISCTGEADTGITFQNSEGEEILILDSIATSVNEITIASAATGNNPSITASGETNVGLNVATKGTGDLNLTAGTGDIVLKCGTAAADKLSLQAYDIDGTAYLEMVKIESHATIPQITICPTAAEKLAFFGATPTARLAKANYNNWAAATDVAGALAALGLVDAA